MINSDNILLGDDGSLYFSNLRKMSKNSILNSDSSIF